MSYTVQLVKWPELAEADRRAAESRFKRALEEKLGGASHVPRCYRAFMNAANSRADTIPTAEAQDAAAYIIAQNAADKAGFDGLGHFDGAHFEVFLD